VRGQILFSGEESLKPTQGVVSGETKTARRATSRAEAESWEGVDRSLFDRLRHMRLTIARARGVSPYVIFHDATLREMGGSGPWSLDALCAIRGVLSRTVAHRSPRKVQRPPDQRARTWSLSPVRVGESTQGGSQTRRAHDFQRDVAAKPLVPPAVDLARAARPD